MKRKHVILLIILIAVAALVGCSKKQAGDPRLNNSFRRPEVNGWTFVHLEGTPSEIGFQHGYLLASEIQEMKEICALELRNDTKKDWPFFRDAAREMWWPHIEKEYREELQGIVDGVKARGIELDLWDIVAMNGMLEWTYYTAVHDKTNSSPPASAATPEHCSAFVATGNYTRDGKPIIAHNNWTYYIDGLRWTKIFDIVPTAGYRILMDGLPGFIASSDDFGINSAGIMITETTISRFEGYDVNGIPEFVRARKAMQCSSSIDDFARIMKEGNNGGYANDWLIADRKTGEIASLELGLKNVTVERKKDGYFASANFPINPKLALEETRYDTTDMGLSANARRLRWEQLMAENKGNIDVAAAQRFLADHFDTYQKKDEPNERTLCGHIDLSPRGSPTWQPPYGVAGTVQNKVADAAMAEQMSFVAAAGHACGLTFNAENHLRLHPEFSWQKKYLKDIKSYPWTLFESSK